MFGLFGIPISTVFQGGTLVALIVLIAGVITVFIRGMPERARVKNESVSLHAKIEEDLRGEAAHRFKEFRDEVHSLRNELMQMSAWATVKPRVSVGRTSSI
jgi:hypothetical protein